MQLSTINSLQAKLVKKMSRGYRPYLKVLTSANPGLARNKRRSIESIHKFLRATRLGKAVEWLSIST